MKHPSSDPDNLCHAITLTADQNFRVEFGTYSQWVGWTEDNRYEIRQSRLVYSDYTKIWEKLEMPYYFVHKPDELLVFLVAGGNALVERKLAEEVFPGLLGPQISIPDGQAGYKSPGLFDEPAFRRAPTPRLRMQIFKRDDRRCRICGRRPDDNSDLVLHVHHIRPWEKGGVTDPANLITICHTCHSGLDPHEDHSLFRYISSAENDPLLTFSHGVSNYRKVGLLGPVNDEKSKRGEDEDARNSLSKTVCRGAPILPHAAFAGLTRLFISAPFFRSTTPMSYWLCKLSQNCALLPK